MKLFSTELLLAGLIDEFVFILQVHFIFLIGEYYEDLFDAIFLIVFSYFIGMDDPGMAGIAIKDQSSLNQAVLQEFQKIVSEYQSRLDEAQKATDAKALKKILGTGSWYAADYYRFLTSEILKGDEAITERLEYLKDTAKFAIGFVEGEPNLELVSEDKIANIYEFRLTTDRASDVIKNFGKNGVILVDCGIAFQLAFYRAALRFWGEDIFDRVFRKNCGLNLFSNDLKNTLISYFVVSVLPSKAT